MAALTPEACHSILQGVVGSEADQSLVPSLENLTDENWALLTRAAIRSRLAHPFRQYLRAHSASGLVVPPVCLGRLDRVMQRTMMANLKQQGVFRKMAEACDAQGIEFMMVKGLWLAETIYQDMSARRSGDIDLLLKPEDMPRFTAMVAGMGYDVPAGVTDIREIAPGAKEHAITELRTGAYIDVHWSLVDTPEQLAVSEETFWLHSEVQRIAGRRCRSLCLEDHLLYLAFHAAILHRFIYVGPRAFMDIAQMIRTPIRPMDWDFLTQRALALGWSRSVWLVFEIARTHFGAAVPLHVLKVMEPPEATSAPETMAIIQQAALFNIWENQNSRESWALTFWTRILLHKTGVERVRFVFRSFFPSSAYLKGYFKASQPKAGVQLQRAKRLRVMVKEKRDSVQRFFFFVIRRRKDLSGVAVLTEWLNS